jgi:hypothetical protein
MMEKTITSSHDGENHFTANKPIAKGSSSLHSYKGNFENIYMYYLPWVIDLSPLLP